MHPTIVSDFGDEGDIFGEGATEFPDGPAERLLERLLMAGAERFLQDLCPDAW